MADTSLGKKWEEVFKKTWREQFPGTFVFRLHDQMNGYREVSGNPCDFLCMPTNKLFLMECKEHKGASIPFADIPQYERLLEYKNMKNTFPGVLVWFSEKDTVIWVSIYEMEKMVNDGEKSIGLRMLKDNKYKLAVLPAEKKRVFMTPDYSCLLDLKEGE